jgi:nitrogen-specific signal transduction histidine kinase
MSRIYSSLQHLEAEKRGKPIGNPLFNIFEERIISGERASDLENLEVDVEKLEYPAGFKQKTSGKQQNTQSVSVFFIEMVNHIKNTLGSIRAFAQMSQGKFKDVEFGDNFRRGITGNIDKMDSELECFFDFIRVTSQTRKANTVHNLLEELLKCNEKKLDDKKIKIAKKQYDKDLPETSVQDDQLRYILNWVLQYTILSVAASGNIGILTQSFDFQEAKDDLRAWVPHQEKYIEILFAFSGWEKQAEPSVPASELRTTNRGDGKNFILPLVEEIVHGNHGLINAKLDHEKQMTQISLVLPVERRKVTVPQEEAYAAAPPS